MKAGARGILIPMGPHHIPWEALIFGIIKLLKVFGFIPGAIAAFGVRKLYQKWRQQKAIAGWPATDATIQSGQVHKQGWHTWVELTYTYFVGEYRSGTHVHNFRREAQADEFLRQVKDKRVHVHYDAGHPEKSVILDRDLEMVALLAPSYR
ncbi:MAG: DUF3592 domain-containing protein [Terracidiphilus sp.]|jgi:hypothetical protein